MTRDRRLLLLVAAAVVAVAVVGVIVALAGGGEDSSSSGSPSTTAGGASRSAKLLAGIPQNGMTLGRPDAPATVVEFADLQCPYCGQYTNKAFPTVVRRFVKTGKVKLRYSGMHFLGSDSTKGLQAVVAAGFQNRAWNLLEELFARQGGENSGWLTDDVLKEAAAAAGVDYDKMTADMDLPRVATSMEDAAIEAQRQGINSTPTFVVVRPPANPQRLTVQSFEPLDFAAALSAALGT